MLSETINLQRKCIEISKLTLSFPRLGNESKQRVILVINQLNTKILVL